MIDYNDVRGAAATIAVMDVPLKEASRFGIMNTNSEDLITSFDEKPEIPKSTKASMGVYVFKWEVLRKALVEDSANPESSHDFGKNIIPMLLGGGEKLYAYEFDGYWKDIGTVDSYYEANMDLLQDNPPFNLEDNSFPIYSNNTNAMPQIIGEDASVSNSLICDGCIVKGDVINSIISKQVYVGKGAVVENSIIMHNARIEAGVKVQDAVVSEGLVVNQGVLKGNIDRKGKDDIRLLYQSEATHNI